MKIDYVIRGHEMQFVEIELDPGESAVAEAGAFMYKDNRHRDDHDLRRWLGQQQGASFMDLLVGAGKRVLTGESLFMTVFTHRGTGKAKVAFARPVPRQRSWRSIFDDYGHKLICQKDAYLAAAKGVSIGIAFQKRVLTGLFAAKGSSCKNSRATASCSCTRVGTLIERGAQSRRRAARRHGCSWRSRRRWTNDVVTVGGVKSMIFGGEGVFFRASARPGPTCGSRACRFRRASRARHQWRTWRPAGRRTDEGSVLGVRHHQAAWTHS